MNEPFDMLIFANRLMRDMSAAQSARHDPAPKDEQDGERWTQETQEEYNAYLDATEEPPC